MNAVQTTLPLLLRREDLSQEQAHDAIAAMMGGQVEPVQIAAWLTAMAMKGECIEEVAGAARAMRGAMTSVTHTHPEVVDTCGTGGDGSHTFNISTASAFVVAACGVPVAKHGNRAITSKSGSSDVLEALGVRIDLPHLAIEQLLAKLDIAFLFAPSHHPAMRHVGPVRAKLGFRTLFNLLGPLTNPAGARKQLIGVYSEEKVPFIAHVCRLLDMDRVMVVHGRDGLDEITLCSETVVAELNNGIVEQRILTPEELGLPRCDPEALKGGDATHNAAIVRAVLGGEQGARRDIVVANAAAMLVVAGKASDLRDGVRLAGEAIDSGNALKTLDSLVHASQEIGNA
ncbi:MAG: anthranilate phosphoribosyltransferase [Alphaproteobacteria bacterium CG_4_10_14_0_2_um_filter_63_37]|nr:MAG: anthranilate phosphoribosyltransferase [Proteobacteria bacterium CG1_02_64_396]PJA24138.1 MAG: anthranilate phosphoribosyltransferase [Alphaproteobacteria bacterium CG_4_10_14_0_2_um_filter_63_37]